MALNPISPLCQRVIEGLSNAFATTNRYNRSAFVPMLMSAANRGGTFVSLSNPGSAKRILEGNRKVNFRHFGLNCQSVQLKPIGCGQTQTAQANAAQMFEFDFGDREAFVLVDGTTGHESIVKYDVADLDCGNLTEDFVKWVENHLARLSEGVNAAIAADFVSQVGLTYDGAASYRIPMWNAASGATVPTVINPMSAAKLAEITMTERAGTDMYMLVGGKSIATWGRMSQFNLLNTQNFNQLSDWGGNSIVSDLVFDRLFNNERRFIFYPQGQAQIVQPPYDREAYTLTNQVAGTFADSLLGMKQVFPFLLPNGLTAEVTIWRDQSGPDCDTINVAARVYAILVTVPAGLTCEGSESNNGIVFVDDCSTELGTCATAYSASRAVTKSSMAAFPAANIVKSPFGSNATITIPGILTTASSIGDVIALLNADPNKPAGSSASINADMTLVTYADAAASITFTANIVIEAD